MRRAIGTYESTILSGKLRQKRNAREDTLLLLTVHGQFTRSKYPEGDRPAFRSTARSEIRGHI